MNTEHKALINALIDTKRQPIDKDDRKRILRQLKKRYTFKALEILTGINDSTLELWLKGDPLKHDSTQTTNRMIKNGIDITVLIRHFKCYMPRSQEEVLELRDLCAAIMDCIKRR